MFHINMTAEAATIAEPVEEIAAAKAAGKCGECYACYGGYHEQCKGKDHDWHTELEADQASTDAMTMNENMRKYGCIDVPESVKAVQRKPVDEVLVEVARDLVLRGSRAGSVYQAMLNIGYTVSIEDCRAAVDAALAS